MNFCILYVSHDKVLQGIFQVSQQVEGSSGMASIMGTQTYRIISIQYSHRDFRSLQASLKPLPRPSFQDAIAVTKVPLRYPEYKHKKGCHIP